MHSDDDLLYEADNPDEQTLTSQGSEKDNGNSEGGNARKDSEEDESSNKNGDKENQKDPSEVVIEFVMKFGKRSETEVQDHLEKLGVGTLSDLGVLDLNTCFKDLLRPVEIGKLQLEYNKSKYIASHKNLL